MNESTLDIPTPVQRRLDEHLDAIDQVLTQTGLLRSERQGIVDEVESQVRDMLRERASNPPTLEQLEAILTELDPPQAYGEADEGMGGQTPQPPAAAQTTQSDHPICQAFHQHPFLWILVGAVILIFITSSARVGLIEVLIVAPILAGIGYGLYRWSQPNP